MAFPGTTEEFPWEHRVFKVSKKIFAFLDFEDGTCSLTVKLPVSGRAVLKAKIGTPTGYGMGKHGWVSCKFEGELPEANIRKWIEESYRAIAPKKLLKMLEQGATEGATTSRKPPSEIAWADLNPGRKVASLKSTPRKVARASKKASPSKKKPKRESRAKPKR
jgi:predicted DNA-binding protein (MmcQ/YjbR family)